MVKKLHTNLKFGWTTGTCATAATIIAYHGLIGQEFPDCVDLLTPSGKIAHLKPVLAQKLTDGRTQAGIIKDAGDDPDVTHGATIIATLNALDKGMGLCFKAGEGVGRISMTGLPLAVGEPAINPVPREMMRTALENLVKQYNHPIGMDVEVEISIPNGVEIAKQTWNPRLGIVGGLSILGTSGVVRPFSCAAWIASIHRGIDVGIANKLPLMIAATGSTSEHQARKLYPVANSNLIDMGDFIGGMLKYMRSNPIPKLLIAGGIAKMVKFASGAVDLHSKRSQINPDFLIAQAEILGLDRKKFQNIHSIGALIENLTLDEKEIFAEKIAELCKAQAHKLLRHEKTHIAILLIARDGAHLAFKDF